MNAWKRRLDRIVETLCRWLNDFFPGNHGLAVVGDGLAGLERWLVLPVDRRVPDNISLVNDVEHMSGKAAKATARGGTGGPETVKWYQPNIVSCSFWAYCYMKGQPCVWCGGKNELSGHYSGDFTPLCPTGKNALQFWYGCCKDPSGGFHLIAFVDCCGTGFCKDDPGQVCRNWREAKGWCVRQSGAGPNGYAPQPARGPDSYYCTVVVDQGDCGS
jgi:hypothetical protein